MSLSYTSILFPPYPPMPLSYPITPRSIPSPGVLPFASESIHSGVGFEWLRNIGGMHVYQLLSNDHMEYVHV